MIQQRGFLGVLQLGNPHSLITNVVARMSSRISAFMKLPHLASAKCWYKMLASAALPLFVRRTHKNSSYADLLFEVSVWSDNRHNQIGFTVSVSNRKL